MKKERKQIGNELAIIKVIEFLMFFVFAIACIFTFVFGEVKIHKSITHYEYLTTITLNRDYEYEDYDDSNLYCDVRYINGDNELVVTYSYEEYCSLANDSFIGYKYSINHEDEIVIDHNNATIEELQDVYKDYLAQKCNTYFVIASVTLILLIADCILFFYGCMFTSYEKIWFASIILLSAIVAVIFPESSRYGISGITIMLLYLLDTFSNILCELLISKQSRYNFLVSLFVEVVEILVCILLMYRFATLFITIFFWIPIDIVSFINWSKHKDEQQEELTVVRRLKGYQEVLVIVGIIAWTVIVGFLISGLDIQSKLLISPTLATIVIYLDACASAVAIANGVFILLRYKEQWIAWYICSFLELVINILCGQYILIVLKVGYLTNTTYGYIKWNNYSKKREKLVNSLL